jgi:hypothetical protein
VKDEQLRNLLQSADSSVPPAQLQAELLKRIRPRARREASVKILVVTLLVATLPILPIYFAMQKATQITRRGSAGSTKVDLKSQIAALDAEARQYEMAAQQLEQQELIVRLRQRQARATERTFEQITVDRCVTAQLMVSRADDLAKNPADREQAGKEYQRVIELFSQTPQAAIAARRLAELKTQT